jgi:glycosyltransferase involved in cell wall biosynthesis
MGLLSIAELLQCAVADRNVCVSRNTRRYIPFARDVIWNGVDSNLYRPGLHKSAAPSIFFLGTMDSRKRGKDLLRVFETEVRPVVPNAELWIAREGNPVTGAGVRWFGEVSQQQLIKLYQQAWIFCLPSSYEGFGVPYIEAMACGTAVVATPNVGAQEVLENGRYGVIASLSELGGALISLLRNEAERSRLVVAGLDRAPIFDWDRIVQAYLEHIPFRDHETAYGDLGSHENRLP